MREINRKIDWGVGRNENLGKSRIKSGKLEARTQGGVKRARENEKWKERKTKQKLTESE